MPDSPTRLVIGRSGDRNVFAFPDELLALIPENARKKGHETYPTGGLNFYAAEAADLHPTERDDHFQFSVALDDVQALLPESALEDFNFPPSKKYSQGVTQSLLPSVR